jgi:cyclic-di-AMP phosphodiesterase PgpH
MIQPFLKNNWRFLLGSCSAFAVSLLIGFNLAIPLFVTVLSVYLRCRGAHAPVKRHSLLYLIFLFSLIMAIATYMYVHHDLSVYWIPLAVVPMLCTILFLDVGIALLLSLVTTVAVAAMAGNDFRFFLVALTGGISSIFFVRQVRRRMAVIRAGLVVGAVQALSLYFLTGYDLSITAVYGGLIANGLVCSFIVLAVLPIFETLFATVTNISLLELADFDHPLLQRLMQDAPGTYHHSLIVGNLAEAASSAVGAHALLARIGSYYHDVGKLAKPGYFSENLGINPSKHDVLSPTMSKMVIMNHVKEGVELARKHHLSERLIDFIQRHHGSSLVYYFYRRALEDSIEDAQVKEDVFRYPGPKPHTKETAIVLLADSVEAATRTLKDPTPAKIEELVHKIINNKFIDGQLDECDLTLKDLEKIAAVFIHVLSGIYHSRIIYPDTPKS